MVEACIPVTVLTGFLGAGKTTLLQRMLMADDRRSAVIVHEHGPVHLERDLFLPEHGQQLEVTVGHGCSNVRGELIRALGALERGAPIERVLVETTGLADPALFAQAFYVDQDLRDRFRLDAIVTVVDAEHAPRQLRASEACRAQVGMADVLLVNKLERVPAPALAALRRELAQLNAAALCLELGRRDPTPRALFEDRGFNIERALRERPDLLEPRYPFEWAGTFDVRAGEHRLVVKDQPERALSLMATYVRPREHAFQPAPADRAMRAWPAAMPPVGQATRIDLHSRTGHTLQTDPLGHALCTLQAAHAGRVGLYLERAPLWLELTNARSGFRLPLCSAHSFGPCEAHASGLSSVWLRARQPLHGERLVSWLQQLLTERGADIHRLKGSLQVRGRRFPLLLQGVHHQLELRELPRRAVGPSDLLLIGHDLDAAALERSFQACHAS